MGPQGAGGTHRLSGDMLEGLPPDFVQALMEIAQLVDIDGDGTPDVAMVPLNQTGGNALMRGFGAPRPTPATASRVQSPSSYPGASW
jgi:hypothetical protein